MKVSVRYFAALREQRGCSEESFETNAETPETLFDELRRMHGFTLDQAHLKIVINEEFAAWSDRLKEGDDIAFIPPVAGG